ncbi:hypothetical protein CPJCM30710_06620 [Clostridium polyendosporum]|uniref:TM2 domain-containing protein n=1 Tax=Clostridium polyendosporum TaxID=69208 RepID=A0A919RX55_9CLOT|nr:TM2 domain-containing protein [Clostridium polyendosporum]GIM27996.1 hypothetical protein CPJCM30710_06620 [Clostridium polyendosporum]
MNCYIHNDREATETCDSCGCFICIECNNEINGKNYCRKCIKEMYIEKLTKIEELEEMAKQQSMVFMNTDQDDATAFNSSSLSSSSDSVNLYPKCTKSRVAAALLAIFLGGLGAHKFYLGQTGVGIVYLLFSWTLVPVILGVIEGIIYLIYSDKVFAAQYGPR